MRVRGPRYNKVRQDDRSRMGNHRGAGDLGRGVHHDVRRAMTTTPDLDAIEQKVNDCALPGYFTDEQWQYFRKELHGLFADYRAQQQRIAELEAELTECRETKKQNKPYREGPGWVTWPTRLSRS